MKNRLFRISDISELKNVAKELLLFCNDVRVVVFNGDLGAGKTTFIKEICRELGVVDNVSSPTFSIINSYINNKNEDIYHFDFYRLKHEHEALDMGYEEYFYSNNFCFIEWPSKIPNLLPNKYIEVIMQIDDTQRNITFIQHS